MSTTSEIVGKVSVRKIFAYSASDCIEELKRHIQRKLIVPSLYSLAILDYDPKYMPAATDEGVLHNHAFYPLKFISYEAHEELWLSCVTTGDEDEVASQATIDALKMMGFELHGNVEEELLTCDEAHREFMK